MLPCLVESYATLSCNKPEVGMRLYVPKCEDAWLGENYVRRVIIMQG